MAIDTCRYDGPSVCAPSAQNQAQLFLSIITALATKSTLKQFCDEPKSLKREYDFIVVGGGSAGAIVAARLSEIKKFNVLLIEAGPEEPLNALVPSAVASLINSDVDWKYRTVNEKNACLSKNGSCPWPRGKNLGGTSVHNGMMYIRGNPEDYRRWDLPNWDWDSVLPYFKRSENNMEFNNEYHSTGGPLHVDKFPSQPPIAKDIIQAADEAGYGKSDDLNGKKITGFTIAQTNNNNGVRVSSATAFLRPVRERENLHVLLNAQVSKLIIEKKDWSQKVVGVQYFKNGLFHIIKVKREVILSAGAIGSPQILLLSGIGPEDDLKSKNIDVVKDVPGVGANLQNHVSYTLSFEIDDLESDLFTNFAETYKKYQMGPLSSTGLSQMTGIVASYRTTPWYPDIQYYFRGYGASCANPKSGKRKVSIVAAYLHPKSRGTLKLASNDFKQHPIITQNYLSRDTDLYGIIEGIKIALNITKAPALKKYNFKLISDPIEKCKQDNLTIESDEYWKCAIKQETDPENHQAGSCRMGRDWMAVVDTKLRVIGVRGLRVADASVLPALTSGNIAAPVMMIGERVADFIKKEYTRPQTCSVKSRNQYHGFHGQNKRWIHSYNNLNVHEFPTINTDLTKSDPKRYPYPPYVYCDA